MCDRRGVEAQEVCKKSLRLSPHDGIAEDVVARTRETCGQDAGGLKTSSVVMAVKSDRPIKSVLQERQVSEGACFPPKFDILPKTPGKNGATVGGLRWV